MAEEIRQSIVSAAQTFERMRGELPGHIKKVVSNILESKMSWKELLAKFITSGFENKTSWNSPNRRFAWSGTYLPRHDGDMMKIAIGIDTSGSCGGDLEKFVSEIECIAKSFGSYELHVIQCDTEVKDYQMFDEFNQIDTKAIEFKGFGGTKLKPIFDYIHLNDIDVNGVVMFTDGECENFEDDGSIELPIMWAISGHDNERKNLKIGEQVFIK
jgi:predicted metal-dependent peptidase